MKITIAVPHYKSQATLARLLCGVKNQNLNTLSLKDVEVLIVNDDLDEKIKPSDFKEIKDLNLKIFNKKHGGVASARNRAIELSSGEIICFLDQDCYPLRNWLEAIIARFFIDKDVAGLGGRVKPLEKIEKSGIVNEYYNLTNRLKSPIIDRATNEIVAIITANCAFRIETLRAIGGFDEKNFSRLSYGGEDVDLTYRLKKKGYKIVYEPSAVVKHEYPDKFSSIFNKYSNYGRGVRIFCISRGIDPRSIRQPGLNLFSFLMYIFVVFRKTVQSFFDFRTSPLNLSFRKVIVFTFFELTRHLAHGYGFFFKR